MALVCLAAYLLVARDLQLAKEAAAGSALVAAALGTTAWSLRRGAARMTSAVVVAWTIAMMVAQFAVDPVPGGADRNMPASASAYSGQDQLGAGRRHDARKALGPTHPRAADR